MSFKADPPPPAVTVTKIAYPGPVIGNPLRRKNTLWLQPSLRGQLCNFSAQPLAISIFHVCAFCKRTKIWSVAWNACGQIYIFIVARTETVLFVNWTKEWEQRVVCVVCSTNLCQFYLEFFKKIKEILGREKYFSFGLICFLDSRNNLWYYIFKPRTSSLSIVALF